MLSPQARDQLKQRLPGLAALLRLRSRFGRAAAIRHYLATHSEPALHLGCGGNLIAGWLNADLHPSRRQVIPVDCTRRLPFADGTFVRVYSEHMIEHIPFAAARAMLAECRRVMKPGGAIRIATPDLAQVCRMHDRSRDPLVAEYLEWSRPRYAVDGPGTDAAHVINSLFYHHGHRFLYDAGTLSAVLEDAGFADCAVRTPGESTLRGMGGLEHHGQVMGEDFNRLETLVVEARVPEA